MSANPGIIKDLSHIELRQRNERLSLLSDIAGLLLLNDDPREILDNIFKMLSAHLGLEAYFNYLVTDDGSRMRLYEYGGISPDTAKGMEWLEYGQAVCGCVARDKKRMVAQNIQCSSDPRTDLIRSLGMTAYCCHPLIAHGRLLGTLSFGTRGRTEFTCDEVELMRTICDLVATSLERAKLISSLKDSRSELEEKVKERTLALHEHQEELKVKAEELEINIETLHARNEELNAQIARRKQNEQLLRHIIDYSPVPMVLYNEKKNEYSYNKKFTETFGYTIEDVPTIDEWWKLAYPDKNYRGSVKKRWYAVVDDAIKNKTSIAPMEVEVTCKDGSKRHILNEFSPIGDVNLSLLYDITDLKRFEEALRKSEAELARGQQISHIGSWTIDIITGELTWSDQSYRNYGLVPGEVKPTYELFLSFIVPEDRERVNKAVQRAVDYAEKYNVVYNIVRKDGENRVLLSENEFIRDDSGKVIGMYGTNQDITERKKAEAELQESEERFRALADNIPNLAWMANADGWIFWYNRQWYDYTGTTLEEMQGWGWKKVHHPDHVEAVIKAWSASIKEGRSFDDIFPLRGKDGSYRWFLTRITPIKDARGKIQRWFGTNTDITDRRNIEQALGESEERLRLAQQVTGIGTFEWNIQTGMNRWTPELEAMYGLPIGGFPGTQEAWEQLVHPADRQEAVRRVSEAMDKGDFEGEWRVIWPDGTVHWLQGRGYVFKDKDGRPLKLLGVNIDITDRQRTEEALQESEVRFRAYMNNSPAIAWMKDAQGRYVYLNKTYEEEFKVRSKDRIGKTDFEMWPHEVAEQFRKSDLEVLVSGRATHVIEETPNKDGGISYWFDVKFPFRNASGDMFVGGFGVDITRQKQVEEALKEAKSRNELYVDLMGHDINNINQVAMGYLEIASESLSLEDDDKELIQKPLEALRASVNLIDNVQKLKRLKSGGLRAEIIDINDVLLELKDQCAHGIDKNININYYPRPDCKVMANGLLKDVFSNLIGNAIKHTLRDHVIINVRLNNSYEAGKKYYKVTVEDNGCGIPDDLKLKIFNRLERGNTKAHGKGLGLYLVKTLVDDFHGKVWVEDRIKGDQKQGSQFIVMLPAFEGETGVITRDSPRIGIVEDDKTILDLYKKIFAKHGMSVEYTAINGIDAVEMVRNANPRPDIIIMDHRMPGMSGLEATGEILKIAPQIKIIFASADAGIEKEALRAGAYKFFHKPVAPKTIIKAINDIS